MSEASSEKAQKLRLIYEKYKNRMYISACRILCDPFVAEDAVHEAFVAILRHIEKIEDVDSVSTASYCIKAAKNTAINMSVKRSRESAVPVDEVDEVFDESMLDMICSKENFDIVVSAIMNLDEKYRDVLSLYYLNELTVKEMADLLCRKESTVKQQLSRGRKKLINIISKEIEDYGKESVAEKSV
ncbi:MAG: RNA polymerase sigma factor [Ruminococcaceae bacterium]|nr:RNA polymerase sigma factor [Oscillospiraceae bacterium]